MEPKPFRLCECQKCGNVWKTRLEKTPKQCPKCHRYDWQESPDLTPKKIAHCNKCDGEWEQRVENPRYCPLCKNPHWNDYTHLGIPKICLTCLYWDPARGKGKECMRRFHKPIANKCRGFDLKPWVPPDPVPVVRDAPPNF